MQGVSLLTIFQVTSHGCPLISLSFGFVMYYSPAAAENCIRGFFHLGFQASYAQVGHALCLLASS